MYSCPRHPRYAYRSKNAKCRICGTLVEPWQGQIKFCEKVTKQLEERGLSLAWLAGEIGLIDLELECYVHPCPSIVPSAEMKARIQEAIEEYDNEPL